jgi:hypothetical protein
LKSQIKLDLKTAKRAQWVIHKLIFQKQPFLWRPIYQLESLKF